MAIKIIINHLTKNSSRISPSSSKFSDFLFYPQSSVSLSSTALESIRTFLYSPQKILYHTNGEYPVESTQSPSSLSYATQNPNWVDNFDNNEPTMITPRGPTPIGRQFESWIKTLQPGFKPEDVAQVLERQTDPDLAYDIFHWTAQQRNYRHNHQTYQIMIETLASGKRRNKMEQLMEEVIAGACIGSVSLFNTLIHNYCQFRMLGPAIAVYKKMQKVPDCKPTVRTYNMLLTALVRRFSSFTVCCVHLRTVKSLYQQMNAAGVDMDIVTLNLLIKAHSMALEMDEALRFYREIGLYGCRPDFYTFNYIIRGFCQKGWMKQALEFYDTMVGESLQPSRGVYNVLVCSLSVGGKLEEAMKALREMVDNGMVPDFLTYKTLLEKLCKSGKKKEAFKLLRELRDKGNGAVLDETTFRRLLDGFKLTKLE